MTTALEPHLAPRAAEPFAAVLSLGDRSASIGARVGLLLAVALHGAIAGQAAAQLLELGAFARSLRGAVIESLAYTVDITQDEAKKPEPPPPEPPPEPPVPEAPAPVAQPAAPREAAAAPPAPAEAGKVLTADPDPTEPVDLTDPGFVQGTGDRYAGGTTTSEGTSKTAVTDPGARKDGVPGGTGKAAPAPPAAPAKDLSRAPAPLGAAGGWDCGFPPEADAEQIDFARVQIAVTVGPDGRAKSVSVLSDPGHGFGRHARQCALRKSYSPGLDRSGQPATQTTPPFTIRFRRR
ncbi:MAG: energy transducer TonB [Polyangiaceae bacterium]|nr:energy transducer TonB [Polyangiaceae bacterium]